MPTANTTSKAATAKRASARTKASTARARSAGQPTRAKAATGTANGAAERVGDYAERAVLIPVGAALIAREQIASSVSETISTYSSPSKTQAQLRRFERRGATARSRLEREVRKTRTRLERELRERRSASQDFANRVQDRVSNLV